VLRRIRYLEESGVRFHLGVEIGRDLSFAKLRRRHAALLIATGVYKARDVELPGAGLRGIVKALDYLTASNRKGLGDEVPAFDSGELDAAGKHVVVIGGGDTAMDCVRTAVRQGAKSVRCLYRRDRANMPGSMREVQHAEEEGVEFIWLAAPEAFVGGERVEAVQAHRMRLGTPDATGRQAPEPVPGSSFRLPADLVIKALGFDPEDLPGLWGVPELAVTRWGTIKIDWSTMSTAIPGVFAAGDIVRGASLVVWAVRDGRDAAAAITRHLDARAGAERQVRPALALAS
jgi:glutamate synthase (NADPH/NADH) small chain